LDELGLTSLDRIELTIALEERAGVTLSEAGVASAQTLSDLHWLVEEAPEAGAAPDVFAFPRWNRARPAQIMRNVSQTTWILPLVRLFLDLHVEGREHLRMLKGPAIFAANHQSHFDTPAILSALPAKWRRSMAVSMWKEYFEPHFFPERYTPMQRLGNSAIYYLVALFFNAFPLPRTEPGARHTLRYVGELVSGGFSILIFPEGHRTEGGEINPFQAGVGIIGSRLRLPVVPLRLDGLERVLHRTWRWPRRGRVRVTFGAPLVLEGDDYAVLARRVEHAVVALQPPDAARSRAPDAA
jgi:long-chain acyl-CoA synthetase